MLRGVVRRRRWAHAPVMHAASHFYHEKRVAWVSISMHACDPVPIVMGLRLAALRAAGAPLLLVYVIAWARGQLRINFTSIFKVFTKLPKSRSDEGNLENFENTSENNP